MKSLPLKTYETNNDNILLHNNLNKFHPGSKLIKSINMQVSDQGTDNEKVLMK